MRRSCLSCSALQGRKDKRQLLSSDLFGTATAWGGSGMNDPKERKHDQEAATLVVSNGLSGSPSSGDADASGKPSEKQAEEASEAPTMALGEAPTLAATATQRQF